MKVSFKIYFHEMEKLFPLDEIFEKLEPNGFHYPENQFPLDKMKNLLKNKFTLNGKNSFSCQE